MTGYNYHDYTRYFTTGCRGWANQIHDVLAERDKASPRRTIANSLALLARWARVATDRKYDCLGVFVRMA